MILDASQTDNINNFTVAGKAAKQSEADKASTALFNSTQDFIKLLTVQLQNQDPTKPMETNELTQQVASLSQVEQQINTNKNLEKLMTYFTQSQVSNSVSYIGKYIEAPGNLSTLSAGQATFLYNLADSAHDVKVTITDPDDNIMFTGDGTKLAGRNTFNWDGKKSDGTTAPDGTYKISVVAKDPSGAQIQSGTSSYGKVTAIETVEGVSYLGLGDILVPMDKVLSVRS